MNDERKMMPVDEIVKSWRRENEMLEDIIKTREAENAWLRQRNEQLVEFLLSIYNVLTAWKNEEFNTESEAKNEWSLREMRTAGRRAGRTRRT